MAEGVGTGRTPKKTSGARIARELRTARIFEGRVAGKRLATIAAEEGVSISRVSKIIEDELDARPATGVGEWRRLEAERLDALQAAVWPRAMAGSVAAVEACLGIMGRRARLFGLDAPARVTVEEGPDPEIARASLEAKLMSLAASSGLVIEGISEDVTTPALAYQIGSPEVVRTDVTYDDLPEPDPVVDLLDQEDLYGEADIFSR